MSFIITKGWDFSVLIQLYSDEESIDLNDGSWTVQAKMKYQTPDGPTANATIEVSESNSGIILKIPASNTSTLDSKGFGYLLYVRAIKDDGTALITGRTPITVLEDDY